MSKYLVQIQTWLIYCFHFLFFKYSMKHKHTRKFCPTLFGSEHFSLSKYLYIIQIAVLQDLFVANGAKPPSASQIKIKGFC